MIIDEAANRILTILLIEDDLVTRGMLAVMLGRKYDVVEAEDGKSGIAVFIKHEPDVVLLDIRLPDLTGYEVATRLKLLNRDSYIVMLSADEADEDLIMAHAQGVDAFFKKPFMEEELLELINKRTVQRAMALSNSSLVDLSAMSSITDGDVAVENELLKIFIVQSDINIEALCSSLVGGQRTSWTEAAHMLKAGAAGIGAEALRRLCENAEQQVDAPLQTLNLLFTEINDEYTQVKNHLINNQLIAN